MTKEYTVDRCSLPPEPGEIVQTLMVNAVSHEDAAEQCRYAGPCVVTTYDGDTERTFRFTE